MSRTDPLAFLAGARLRETPCPQGAAGPTCRQPGNRSDDCAPGCRGTASSQPAANPLMVHWPSRTHRSRRVEPWRSVIDTEGSPTWASLLSARSPQSLFRCADQGHGRQLARTSSSARSVARRHPTAMVRPDRSGRHRWQPKSPPACFRHLRPTPALVDCEAGSGARACGRRQARHPDRLAWPASPLDKAAAIAQPARRLAWLDFATPLEARPSAMQNPFSDPTFSMANLTAAPSTSCRDRGYGRLESAQLCSPVKPALPPDPHPGEERCAQSAADVSMGSPGLLGQRDKRKMRSFVILVPLTCCPKGSPGLRAFGSGIRRWKRWLASWPAIWNHAQQARHHAEHLRMGALKASSLMPLARLYNLYDPGSASRPRRSSQYG